MNKTVLITGASTGIGLATAKYFAEKNWNVIATMRTPEKMSAELSSERILVCRLDVTDEASIQSAVEQGLKRFQSIDVLVNNAGYGVLGVFEAASIEIIKKQFDTNVFGLMNVMRAVLPQFRKQKAGVIINISSVGGRATFPMFSLYHATKFAVEGLTESMMYELMGLGVKVKLVQPGGVNTDFAGRSLDRVDEQIIGDYTSFSKTMTAKIENSAKFGNPPIGVAKVIYRAATDGKNRIRYNSGLDAHVLMFFRKILPDWIFLPMLRLGFKVL